MSGQPPYPSGVQSPYNTAAYSVPAEHSGPSQNYGWPQLPEKSGQQPLQNGPSPGNPIIRTQAPPSSGGQVGQPPSGGDHLAGSFPPPTASGPHPQASLPGMPLTYQFNSMGISDQNKMGIRSGVPAGAVGGPPHPSVPPAGSQINGPSQVRGVAPVTSGAAPSHVMPPINVGTGLPPRLVAYPSNSMGPYAGSLPGGGAPVPSPSPFAGGVQPPSTIGGLQSHSSVGGPPQSSGLGGQPHQPGVVRQHSHIASAGVVQQPGGFQGQMPPPPPPLSQHQPPPPGPAYTPSSHTEQSGHLPYTGGPAPVLSGQGPQHQPPNSTFGMPSQGVQLHAGHSPRPPYAGDQSGKGQMQQHPSPATFGMSPQGVQPFAGHSVHPSHAEDPSKGQIHQPPPSSVHGMPSQNVQPHVAHSSYLQHTGEPSVLPSSQGQLHQSIPTSVYGVPPRAGGPPNFPSGQGQIYNSAPGTQYGIPSQTGHSQQTPHFGKPPHSQGQVPAAPAGPLYGVPSHSGQPAVPPQAIGPPSLPPGQRQMPPPPGQDGHFPGSASYGQQPIGYQGQQPPAQPVQSPQQPKRLDPDQMPSPIQVIEDDKKNRGGVYQTNTKGTVPPLVTTQFTTEDQGNANPRFLRSTLYNVPCTADLLKSSHIPFALVVTPFAELGAQEQPPPVVDLGELGPVRCKRCKAYMNPFMQFIDGGRRFQCVFCSAVTDVPNEYFAHLDHTGRRVDCFSRPELCLGSYEFVVTKDYCKDGVPPKAPAFIFMIDVSYNSVRSGLIQLICDKLKSEILVHLPKEAGAEESEIRVGIVTYHRELHFYNVKSSLAQPQMMVVSDIEDVFVPTVDGFLVKLSESEALIDSLLSQIPELFAESKETELVLGPVIQAGLDALRSANRSGRLYIFHTGLPMAEAPGKLKNRDDRKLLGTEKEKTVLTPQTSFYSKLGTECVAAGCSVDLFLFPNQYCDVATISDVCKVTAGSLYKYSYFQADTDGERFLEDLKASLKRSQAFDAILRVRTSTGIRPVDFYGNFYMANTTDVEMASLSHESTVCLEVKHDDKLSEAEGAYVQVATLYTSVAGQRRLRCHNLSFSCCSQMVDLFRNCELDVLINFYAKQALRTCLKANPKQVKDHLTDEVAQLLACYRKNCANPSSPGQLVLPECMKLLPLYANCILKNDGISGGSEISTDDRSYVMFLLNGMSVKMTSVLFYPRLLPVHNLDVDSSEFPVAIRCSVERLEDSGMYILENGLSMFLWVGHSVSPDLVKKVFGVTSVGQIDTEKGHIPQLDNPVSRRLCQIINRIREERSRYLKLTIVIQRDKLQPWFDHFLVEDKTLNSGVSYIDFLLHIHKEIRNILS